MKRFLYDELKKWKLSETRKPLIMYGARQVDKTYIIKEFGEQEYICKDRHHLLGNRSIACY